MDLTFPLEDGSYYVVNGGSVPLVNFHARTLRPQMRRYRGQAYALDIVKLNAPRLPSKGLLAKAPDSYEIFGQPAYAPCTGTVSAARNEVADRRPLRHPSHLLGDYVAIDCKGVMVLLSHLQRGGVRVGSGSRVSVGEPIAGVGDSGY